jgi:REP element-mobilizing transposase RayT
MSNLNENWDDNEFPLAYLITFRTFGTWLHGDERGSVDRHEKNIYGTPDIKPNSKLKDGMLERINQPSFLLDARGRIIVERSVRQVCENRKYFMHAVNARSNHVHTVISAEQGPEKIINTLKSYATRELKTEGLIEDGTRVWSRGGSRQYLWKSRNVALAIEYVLYGQGDIPIEL